MGEKVSAKRRPQSLWNYEDRKHVPGWELYSKLRYKSEVSRASKSPQMSHLDAQWQGRSLKQELICVSHFQVSQGLENPVVKDFFLETCLEKETQELYFLHWPWSLKDLKKNFIHILMW